MDPLAIGIIPKVEDVALDIMRPLGPDLLRPLSCRTENYDPNALVRNLA